MYDLIFDFVSMYMYRNIGSNVSCTGVICKKSLCYVGRILGLKNEGI